MAIRPPEILILDDDPLAIDALSQCLLPYFRVWGSQDPFAGEQLMKTRPIDLAIVDLNLGRSDGWAVFQNWQTRFPHLQVLFCSDEKDVRRVLTCVQSQARAFIPKPFTAEEVVETVRKVLMPSVSAPSLLLGESAAICRMRETIRRLKGYSKMNVLILGETGTGKELVAKMLHEQERTPRPFVSVNISAIPATLVESELFGAEAGAFTDAKSRAGYFERANQGDIFLDEIGDLSLSSQVSLLRAVQEKEIKRIGSMRSKRMEFRVLSATHQNLARKMEQGLFRPDIYYRLAEMVIEVPPLRDRREDIPLLAEHFLRQYAPGRTVHLSAGLMQNLTAYDWPGNVRELQSTIKRAIPFARRGMIREVPQMVPEKVVRDLHLTKKETERELIQNALISHPKNPTAAQRSLGLTKSTFYRKIKEHNLPF